MTYLQMYNLFIFKRISYDNSQFTQANTSLIMTEAYRKLLFEIKPQLKQDKELLEAVAGVLKVIGPVAPTDPTFHTIPTDWLYPVFIKQQYIVTGDPVSPYYRTSEVQRLDSLFDVNDQAKVAAPRYYRTGTSINFASTVEGITVSSVNIIYISIPEDIDIVANPSHIPLVSADLQDKIIEKTLEIAAKIDENPTSYGMQENTLNNEAIQ